MLWRVQLGILKPRGPEERFVGPGKRFRQPRKEIRGPDEVPEGYYVINKGTGKGRESPRNDGYIGRGMNGPLSLGLDS